MVDIMNRCLSNNFNGGIAVERRTRKEYLPFYIFALYLFLVGILMGDYRTIPEGLKTIIWCNDILITDYVGLAGMAAAFTNAALVTLISAELLRIGGIPLKGKAIFVIGLMSGFALFGKNIFNMWFILLGAFLNAKVRRVSWGSVVVSGLLAAAIGPIVSTVFFYPGYLDPKWMLLGFACGVIIGFVIPILSAHTATILHGMSLYNLGFSVGLIAMVLVPVLKSFGVNFVTETIWATEYNFSLGLLMYVSCAALIIIGIIIDRKNAIGNFFNILKRPGIPTEDFCDLDGYGAVLVNIGVNGIISTTYLLLIGGHINGATIGGILTVMGFGAQGKHAKNIIPIMIGVAIGGYTKVFDVNAPGVQFAALFGTTLAPIAGTYGIIPGIITGFIHSSVVQNAGLGYSGANLYNNGYCGGLLCIVLFVVFREFIKNPNTYSEPSPSMIPAKEAESEEIFENTVDKEEALC